ncbi:probable serine/threonine-protein kinase DDB_G0282963 isoform X2 [Oppia nitens]|uniref:probable serine/threonine-protein kinase DDB_G0282963 isoform X2 n=1 Tax=Oppia nitens TaxID=1686743 RepID=UPI0023DA5C0C|nr:probable serine/threonine-protein kinase DDB_G0282963 isoform X2 [Oppia nitens]
MDDQIKIYDTVRAANNQFLYYNACPANTCYNTTNSAKLKKSNHWTNIFTWKKKTKQCQNSIINYPFASPADSPGVPVMAAHRYSGSMSAATGIAYAYAQPTSPMPGPDYITATTTTTTTIHASIRSHSPVKRPNHQRNSLFYTPWESFHEQSAQHLAGECTCNGDYSTSSSAKDKQRSLRGLSSKSVPMLASPPSTVSNADQLYARRMSRMDLYSLDEEVVTDKPIDIKSKSSDSLLDIKRKKPTTTALNAIKSSRSSTTLNGSPFHKRGKSETATASTVNERFLKFFRKSSTDIYNSVASRKSILECNVSAYDLIKQSLKSEEQLFEDEEEVEEEDIDDSLSDNAIENDTIVRKSGHKLSQNKKSFDGHNGTGLKSKGGSLSVNSVRIGGYGVNFVLPSAKLRASIDTKTFATLDSSTGTPSNSSWSASSGDEDDYDDTYSRSAPEISSSDNFKHLKLSYSPPLPPKRLHTSHQTEDTTNNLLMTQSSNETTNVSIADNKLSNGPPAPPPLPPPLEVPIITTKPVSLATPKNLLKPSLAAVPDINNFHCELKDKLNSGVKSILKKTNYNLSKSESDITKPELSESSSSAPSTDVTCDYLRTFKEFKESRLRNIRHRKHVHFKSHSHDRLIIGTETIPEVEEYEDPIYDDVQVPSNSITAIGATDDASDTNTDNSDNNNNNVSDCGHQFNESSSVLSTTTTPSTATTTTIESDINNKRTIKSVTIDNNCLVDDTQLGTTTDNRTGSSSSTGSKTRGIDHREPRVVNFSEFDPSEHTVPSLVTRAQTAQSTLLKGFELTAHNNTLSDCPNRFISNNNINSCNKNNVKTSDNNPEAVNHNLKALVVPIKTVSQLPAAPTRTIKSSTTTSPTAGTTSESRTNSAVEIINSSANSQHSKSAQVVKPVTNRSPPIAKPRDDRKVQSKQSKVNGRSAMASSSSSVTTPIATPKSSPQSSPTKSTTISPTKTTVTPLSPTRRQPPQAVARANKLSTINKTQSSVPDISPTKERNNGSSVAIVSQKVSDRQTPVQVSQQKGTQNHNQRSFYNNNNNHNNYNNNNNHMKNNGLTSDNSSNVVGLDSQTNLTLNNSCFHMNNNNNTEIENLDFNNQSTGSVTTIKSIIDDNSSYYGTGSSSCSSTMGSGNGLSLTSNSSGYECLRGANSDDNEQDSSCTPYITTTGRTNPYLCTISIRNGSDNRVINQTSIETNSYPNNLSANVIQFESIDSSNSFSSLYDSGAQSSTDSLTNDCTLKKSLNNESPITVFYSNPNDKIIINVSSDTPFEGIDEHIYEELDNESVYVDTDSSLENAKSIFDGASKDEILEFLEDAKERVGEDILVGDTTIDANIEIMEAIDVIEDMEENPIINAKNLIETTISSNRRNRTSNVSNSSTESTATTSSSIDIEEDILLKCAITNSASVGQLVERNDSGVGAETSKPSRLRKLSLNDEVEHQCADCEMHVDPNEDDHTGLLHYPLFCHRCDKKRSERKEIISEIVDTEFKYGRDLRIIREEFYRPIEIAGLLTKEQLKGVFINLDELIGVNSKFSEKLQDAIDIATEQGDEDFTTVNIGKLFRDNSSMLHAFESYCVRQGSAALLLNHLEKEKELLRIFLRVSQMENTLLRRMNLRSFLVVPVQRVTKYPLLLNRLYKVTPYHHRDREALRESQQKVELHLEHINQQTKGTIGATTRIWRRISNLSTSHRRLNCVDDIGNIKLRKAALEILKWNQEETQFVSIGKVLFTSITDYTVNRKTKTLKFLTASALLVTLGRPNQNYRPDLVNNNSEQEKDLIFPRDNTGITDSVLLLIKERLGRYALCKEILNLKTCVISSESDCDEMFEIHEQISKESLLFKGETVTETKDWLKQLRYHSKDLGNWRRRRNALANIMMVRQ